MQTFESVCFFVSDFFVDFGHVFFDSWEFLHEVFVALHVHLHVRGVRVPLEHLLLQLYLLEHADLRLRPPDYLVQDPLVHESEHEAHEGAAHIARLPRLVLVLTQLRRLQYYLEDRVLAALQLRYEGKVQHSGRLVGEEHLR